MGLSKPIIITSSSVDISGLATKSDMTTLQNSVTSALSGVGGAVNSVQHLKINTSTTNYDQNCTSSSLGEMYKDFTISAVNTAKSFCVSGVINGSDAAPFACEFLSSTKLRVYYSKYYNAYQWKGTLSIVELK